MHSRGRRVLVPTKLPWTLDRRLALGQRNDKTKKINNTINRLKSSNRTPKIRLVYDSFYTQTCIHLSHTYYYYNNIRDTYMHLVPVWLGAVLRTPYVHMYVPCTVRRPHCLITLHATPNWWLAGR